MQYDTIAAPITGDGTGAVSIIRLSGEKAIEIADKIFNGRLLETKSRLLRYGKIIDKDKNILDDCLAVKMVAPSSYTGEDTVEFYLHGGKTVRECVLYELISNGARIAERGEFTKRAFLNGKMDLTQAESVIDAINAPTKKALTFAQKNLDGNLRKKVEKIRTAIIAVIMGIMAGNDFPDETGGNDNKKIIDTLQGVLIDAETLCNTFSSGKIIRNGITCGIFGKPNVGKSSLLNAFLDEDRAIVTEIAGTTRDVITEAIDIGGYMVNIADTAGLRESEDVVEKAGIEKTKKMMKEVDFSIYVLDATTDFDENEAEKADITVINKCDIKAPKLLSKKNVYNVSAKSKQGLDDLVKGLEIFIKEKIEAENSCEEMIFAERHYNSLQNGVNALKRAVFTLENNYEPDIASIDLEDAAANMGEITGQTVNDEVIDSIFKSFCIGK